MDRKGHSRGCTMGLAVYVVIWSLLVSSSSVQGEIGSNEAEDSGAYDDTIAERLNFFFTSSAYNATIIENAVGRTYITPDVKMGIYMSDPTVIVNYKIKDGDDNNLFKAEERTVGNFCFLRIRIRTGSYEVINRERKDKYHLTVRATGRHASGPKFSTQVDVTVHVIDVNDMSPLFEQSNYIVDVPENTPIHESILKVSATDADFGINGEIYFSFSEMSDMFAIHPTNGIISLTRPLSYIEKSLYKLDVFARDRGPQYGRRVGGRKASVDIRVVEVNSHAPQIRVQNLPEVAEDGMVGTVYSIVYVRDKDYGANGKISSVDIVDGNRQKFFTLEKGDEEGQYHIKVAKVLDRENFPNGFNLTIQATDHGNPPRFSTKVIHVKLSDKNDQVTQFEMDKYNVSIEECVPIHTPLLFVKALDKDQGKNGEIHYRIQGGNYRDWFIIHPRSGLLSVAQVLDAELNKKIELTVFAEDQGNRHARKTNSVKVAFNIIDCNDNYPVFNVTKPSVSIDENLPVGSLVYKISAYDLDQGDNGYISYSIANDVPFKIDDLTGEVTTTKVLDYESMRRLYIVRIRASDWGSPFRREAEVILKVKLRDVNDNTPQFEKVDCMGHVSRESTIGTKVVTTSAIDFDTGNIISYQIVKGNEDECFEMLSSIGVIKTACDLNEISENVRSLFVTATDGENVAIPTTVNITLVNNNRNKALSNRDANVICTDTDVTDQLSKLLLKADQNNMDTRSSSEVSDDSPYTANSYRPRFPHSVPVKITIQEGLPVGEVVQNLAAIDGDHGYNGRLNYVIAEGNEGGAFKVDTYSGDMMVMSDIDREKKDLYTISIIVSDMADEPKDKVHILDIEITDVNDNSPVFDKSSYPITVSEDTAVNTTILKVSATDMDILENSHVTYSILTDVKEFYIEPISGLIHIAQALDREYQEKYELLVQAKDGSLDNPQSSVVSVEINLSDVNDNPPIFKPSSYHIHIREDLPVGALVMTLAAQDPDLEGGGIIRYMLIDNSSSKKFKIDHQTGTLKIISELDFETQPMYNLTIEARDRGLPSLISKCEVMIEIIDVNENLYAPLFMDFVFHGRVQENRASGTEVIQIIAEDEDDRNPLASRRDYQLTYKIVFGSGIGRFTIDNKGVVKTNSILDRESQSFYWLTVLAEDRGTVPQSSWVELYIEVEDVNDNTPQTLEPVYYPIVVENSDPGVEVLRLQAEDQDDSSSKKLIYKITSGNPQGFFSVDRETGVITTTSRTLDREKQEEHILEVTVADNGTPPLSSTTRVVVTVSDDNDEVPTFTEMMYRVRIPEMPGSDYDMPLYRVIAYDRDVGVNTDIDFSIKTGKGNGRFKIGPKTGMIYSQKEFVAGTTYDLTLRAIDNGRPQQKSSARLVFEVVGIPENSLHAPVFNTVGQSVDVVENDPIGHMVVLMDADDEDNDKIWYSIMDGNEEERFSIDTETGNVILAGLLDWEMRTEYNLTIQASDAVHYTRTWLHITVLDINDNRPQFTQNAYTASLSESSQPGTTVLTVIASDMDQDQRLFYTIHTTKDKISQGKFKINSETDQDGHWTGVITTMSELDRESVSRHELTIMVRDQGAPSKRSLARVTVYVRDHNDHAPEFLTDTFDGRVFETAAMGTGVVRVIAIDRDKGINAQIRYAIISGNTGNTFSIDSTTGMVRVAKQLDRHSQPEYMLMVKAVDGGSPSLTGTVRVRVEITVASNAPPKFKFNEYTTEVEENKAAGTYIIAVSAESQSSIIYEITNGDENQNFDINSNSGVIASNIRLDYEKQEFYNLTVTATNMLSSAVVCNVHIHIIDLNDNYPIFTQDVYVGNISEEVAIGSQVLDNTSSPLVIKATDADTDRNALLTYRIVESQAREVFEIHSSTGAIQTIAKLDHEASALHTFTVQVQDLGTPRKSAEVAATVQIYIGDVNDSPPEFDLDLYTATLLLPTYEGVVVLTVNAEDRDSEMYSRLEYSITSGNKGDFFAIHPQEGVITVADIGDMLDSYQLVVSVSDGMYQATCNVKIQVDLTQFSGLQFTNTEYTAAIEENLAQVIQVALVQATGHSLNEHVSFSILNPHAGFQIGATSGVVQTTGQPFDREQKDNYTLVVQIQDGRTPVRMAQTLVNIQIIDKNDNAPKFMRLPYYTMVSLDVQRGDLVRKVYTVDQDIGPNGQIEYTIVSGDEGKFSINTKTGDITVRRTFIEADENREFLLMVRARDKGFPALSSTVEVPITIKNKNTPVFTHQFYEVSAREDIAMYTTILSVEAHSPTGRKLIYSIFRGNIYGEFDVDFSTDMDTLGPCSVVVIDKLDYETKPHYELTVRATDTMTGSFAEAIVKIQLQDVNDNPPAFEKQQYISTVSEASPIGTEVLTVTAIDPDTGINAELEYRIESSLESSANDSDYFHIDSERGLILTKQKLDHEYKDKLEFTVSATDSGIPSKTTSVRVSIRVSDLNDNRPQFDQHSYEAVITDLAKRGQFVTVVTATDRDSSDAGKLSYSIVGGNEKQAFVIDAKSGIIALSSLRRPDLFPNYLLNVSVTDGVFNNFARAKVTVRNSNSHVPVFSHVLYDVDISENLAPGTRVTTVRARDNDQGIYGDVVYDIESEDLKDTFRIDSESGELFTDIPLNREETSQYLVPVSAKDGGGRAGYASVRVNVADQGDHRPYFKQTNYRANVYATAAEQTFVMQVSAVDEDLGTNGDIKYSLYDGDGIPASEWFDIDRNTGEIKTKKSLTRKENEVFQFFVRAQDKGSPPKENDVPVEVFIMNNEDYPPVFEKTSYNYFISENRPQGSIIATIQAESNDSLRYSIVPGENEFTNKPEKFHIDEDGKIKVRGDLDRETTDMFELSIMAATESGPSLVSTCKVTVQIMDINDNAPEFETNPYTVELAENAEIGSTVIQVIAHDDDTGANADLQYSFSPADSRLSNIFFLEPETGWIMTLVTLDRETVNVYEFSVVATDRGANEQMMDTAVVKVVITDHNDEPPVFSQALYKGSVMEDALPGTVVLMVVTHDLDLGANAEVAYSITGGDLYGQFSIKDSGDVYVFKPLDREALDSYDLEITASDGAFISKANVQVAVLDANDNTPVCEKPVYESLVPENKDLGSFILQVAASDADEPSTRFSSLTYTLEDGFGVFNIDVRSGIISNRVALDRETTSEYHLFVRATDGGGLYCTMEVVLRVTDINDNAPVFVNDEYSVMIPEDSAVRTLLTRVSATDIDLGINRQVQYALKEDMMEHFSINPLMGIVSLRKQVDRERQPEFNITIYAHDQGTPKMTTSTQLIVHVLDINDNPPEFEHQVYHASVSEAIPTRTVVMRVFATSRDSGINAEIAYSVIGGNEQGRFSIDSNTGAVVLKEGLDYESAREYFLTIEATDKGTPPLKSTAVLKINVTDHNDNSPVFARKEYHVSVREDMVVGTSVLQVLASDLDSEPNAMATYYIVRGDDDHQFAVQQQEGYLTVNEPLDRELISSYTLEVHAVDSGSPQLTGSAIVHITILDVNDRPPMFNFNNYSAVVQEDKSIGHSVNQLLVTDEDLDPNGAPFTFDILEGNDNNEFRINRDGEIYTTATFDRQIKDHYKLIVRVFDNGKIPLYSDTEVSVYIIEESAYPPKMSSLKVTVTASGDEYCGKTLGRMTATDRDPYDTLTYSAATTTRADSPRLNQQLSLEVNADDGTVSVTGCLDAGTYLGNVSVTDGKFEVFTQVKLSVVGIEENMAASAVVVRLQDMSPEEFIRDHRDDMISALQEVFSVPQSQVHVVSVQASSDEVIEPSRRKRRSNGENLDVLVAIGELGSNYVSRNRARKTISRSKSELEDKIGVDVVRVISDVCPQDACGEGSCVTEVHFVPGEERTIMVDGQSYVSPKYEMAYSCNCPQGYSGVFCDVIVNLCEPNPCPAPRQCVIDGLDYSCECPPGTSGEDCEFDCDGPDCFNEITFSGKSYVVWKVTVPMERRMHLGLEIKTVQTNARLMYVEGIVDYSILEIEHGFLQFRFDCGSGEGFARVNNVLINDGYWHSILVERNSRAVKITIDGKYTGEGSAPGGNDVLNLDGNMYFGGEVQGKSGNMRSGYVGCMKNMKVDNVKLPLSGSSAVGVMQRAHDLEYSCRGVYIPGVCSSSPCQNGGSCIPVGQESFMCQCRSRFLGSRCETDTNPCASNPCQHGGRCENRNNGYRCICPNEFQGDRCDQTTFCKSSPCYNGGKCTEGVNTPVCECVGFQGVFCEEDTNECLNNPCENNGQCVNSIGSFKCNCTIHATGPLCAELVVPRIVSSKLPFGLGVEELIGIAVAIIVVLVLVIIFVVIIKCRRHRKRHQPLKQGKTQKDMYYSEDDLKKQKRISGNLDPDRCSNIYGTNNSHSTPGSNRAPPPVPARPASYTPSMAESMNTLNNYGMDSARNYGSAGDDLNDIPTLKEPIKIPEFLQMKDFDPVKPGQNNKSPPPPPRKSDSQGPSKRNWDPNIAENYPDDPKKKQHKVMPNGQSLQKVPLLQRVGDSIVSLPITEGDEEAMQAKGGRKKHHKGYHWDTSDWHPDHNPLPEISELPSNSVHNTPLPNHRTNASKTINTDTANPDNIQIDPNEYSYNDLQEEDEFIDPEYVCESEFTDNDLDASDNDEINDIDSEFDPPDYQDILKGDFSQYMPHYSDIENSQAGDSRWGSRRDIELNGNSEGVLPGEDDVIHYGFSLPRPRNKHFRPQNDNRFSGEFNLDYTDHIPMQNLDDGLSISMAGYQSTASASSISNLCDIEDSEANLSDSDSENQSCESTKLVKSSTNIHTVV